MDRVVEPINLGSNATDSARIDDQINEIAKATEAEIRTAASKALDGKKVAITEEQREELIGIMLNMTRNVRARNSYSMMRNSDILVETVLHPGVEEPAACLDQAPGSWRLFSDRSIDGGFNEGPGPGAIGIPAGPGGHTALDKPDGLLRLDRFEPNAGWRTLILNAGNEFSMNSSQVSRKQFSTF